MRCPYPGADASAILSGQRAAESTAPGVPRFLPSLHRIHGARADGAVTGGMGANAGGLIGYLDGGSVTASSASGDVAGGAGSHVGGLVGMNVGQISNASASGQVTSKAGLTLGGLVGWNSGSVSQSSASGKINPLGSGYTVHGGLIGVNFGRQSFNKVEGEAAKVPMMGLEFGI